MARLLLARHGQAMYGHADHDRLSPRGQEQARALGQELARQRIDAWYVGPLRRQRETAELAGVTATILPELAEYPGPELISRLGPRIAEDPELASLATRSPRAAFQLLLQKWSHDEWTADGLERVGAFVARVRAGFDRVVGDLRSGASALVVTSAGPIGVAVGLAFGASALHMVRASTVVRNASLSELKLRTGELAWHEQASLVAFNSIAHLPAELHTEY
jgi:broad specificity phosphatase PhoE